jgi:pimeloyl-ACP methyl ester carboxylesterase
VAVLLAWLLNLIRWSRHTTPEALPPPPSGSTTVTAPDGTQLYAQVGGTEDGEVTVVLVHGLLARTMSFDMQWHHLTPQARVIRYDHRNHGRSDHVAGPLSVATLAGDLGAVIDQLAPTGRLVLVGQSMGGMTVLALSGQRPDLFRDRVSGVALLGAGAGHDIDGHPCENGVRWAARRGLLAPALGLLRAIAPVLELLRPRRTSVMRAATRSLVFGRADVDPALLGMTQQLLEEPPLTTLAALQGSLLRLDLRASLPLLRDIPVLVLAGEDDRLVRAEHSRRMAADLGPLAELVLLPGAGHVVNQSRATETNAALDRLLRRSGREQQPA